MLLCVFLLITLDQKAAAQRGLQFVVWDDAVRNGNAMDLQNVSNVAQWSKDDFTQNEKSAQ